MFPEGKRSIPILPGRQEVHHNPSRKESRGPSQSFPEGKRSIPILPGRQEVHPNPSRKARGPNPKVFLLALQATHATPTHKPRPGDQHTSPVPQSPSKQGDAQPFSIFQAIATHLPCAGWGGDLYQCWMGRRPTSAGWEGDLPVLDGEETTRLDGEETTSAEGRRPPVLDGEETHQC
ncbi:hypothetical protein EMCRGX_G010902 [Ephydatia muelleri]